MAKGKKQQDFPASGGCSSSAAEGIIVVTTGGSNADGSISSRDTPKVEERTRKRKRSPREPPPQQRSSAYRGVTRHRWTGRYEAHLWDKDWLSTSQKKRGKQVYLGAYAEEEAAARAYDLAALKFWGRNTVLNFPLPRYEEELKEMEGVSKEEYISSLRRKSSGFSRGVSKYRGVARHHQNGRWEARIGKVLGNKYLYLGTYATEEEAAKAYDMAAIQYRGINAITNFDSSRYATYLRPHPAGLDADPDSSHATTSSSSSCSDRSLPPGSTVPPAVNFHPDEEGAGSPGRTQPWGGGDIGTGDSPGPAPGLLLHSSIRFEQRTLQERAALTSLAAEGPAESPDSSRAPSRCSFPDDVQTYFECQDGADDDDFVFGDLDDFVSSVFQWEGLLDC